MSKQETEHETIGFTVGFTVGEPSPGGGPSVAFFTGVMTLLGRQYSDRLVTQDAWDSLIEPLGQVEQRYLRLARGGKRREKPK